MFQVILIDRRREERRGESRTIHQRETYVVSHLKINHNEEIHNLIWNVTSLHRILQIFGVNNANQEVKDKLMMTVLVPDFFILVT